MSSIIEGYNYDIFISYRQKDNKYDGWVTDFVSNLVNELESVFKEEISLYFDTNPHDGLLETHDVDATLKEKLKCLVFIPVISRTYCDQKSFAWEHEFKAFIRFASADQFGLKVNLPNGNVASRILPIKIHDIGIEDISLFETETGGVLRGVDFIYKSAGVNRPLRNNEDHPGDNLNRTYYRDQINKVANAVEEIISGLRSVTSGQKLIASSIEVTDWKGVNQRTGRLNIFKDKYKLKRTLLPILAAFCLFTFFMIYREFNNDKTEKAIALIPLRVVSDDKSLVIQSDNFLEAVNDKLSMVKRLKVIPRISTLPYRDIEVSLERIRNELKINYLVDGNIRMEDEKIVIWIELSEARTTKALWSKKYVWEKNRIPVINREIAVNIAECLNIKLSEAELRMISTESSPNVDANLNFIAAKVISDDAWFYYNYGDKMVDSTDFISAVRTYGKAIEFDSMFAQAYARRAIAISWGFYTGQLDSSYISRCRDDIDKALSINKDLYDASIALGFYFYYCKNDLKNAIIYFREAANKKPDEYHPLFYLALVYRRMGEWEASQKLIHKVIKYNPKEALFLTNIGLSYSFIHKFDSALIFHDQAIECMPNWWPPYSNKFNTLILKDGKPDQARAVIDTAIIKTGEGMARYKIMANIYSRNYLEALHYAENSADVDFESKGYRFLTIGLVNSYLNKNKSAFAWYDSAVVSLKNELKKDPEDYVLYGALGLAYAGLKNKDQAISEARKAIKLAGNNSMKESDMLVNLAQVYTMVGDYSSALKIIQSLLENPSSFSVRLLELDPVWEPLQNSAEYTALIKNTIKNEIF